MAALAVIAVAAMPAVAARIRVIRVGDFFFVKNVARTPTVYVSRGRIVEWKWVGMEDHNVTVVRGPVKFHSRTQDHGIYRRRMTRSGTYLIECTIHGFKMRMIVGRPPSVPTQPAPSPSPAPYPY